MQTYSKRRKVLIHGNMFALTRFERHAESGARTGWRRSRNGFLLIENLILVAGRWYNFPRAQVPHPGGASRLQIDMGSGKTTSTGKLARRGARIADLDFEEARAVEAPRPRLTAVE